jgi:hypothetical protein
MTFLHGLALVLLTMVGYTSGAASVAGRRQPVPFLTDLPVLGILWAASFFFSGDLGRWPGIAAAFGAAFAVSLLITLLRMNSLPPAPKTTSREGAATPGSWRRLLGGWKAFSRRMGNYQGRLILAFFYFTVVLPFGLPVRLLSDPLSLRKRPGWIDRHSGGDSMDHARLQF